MFERRMDIDDIDSLLRVFGNYDENINLLEKEFNVTLVLREQRVKILGDKEDVILCENAINAIIDTKTDINQQTLDYIISLTKEDKLEHLKRIEVDCICVTATGKPVRAKTIGQKEYLDAIANNIVTFGVGPAGTGKTYLAVAMAVKAFRANEINRIILTRPAVEAGEKLGFLPGDIQMKVDPYLRPLYDALFDMFGADNFQKHLERGTIEVAPLAYMRGRTLDESFIILDEAQNTTKEQMKMFLTRLGSNSRAVITGDKTQIDLPDKRKSGLLDAVSILENVDQIEAVNLTSKDVVRCRIVGDIVNAYSNHDKMEEQFQDEQSKSFNN